MWHYTLILVQARIEDLKCLTVLALLVSGCISAMPLNNCGRSLSLMYMKNNKGPKITYIARTLCIWYLKRLNADLA